MRVFNIDITRKGISPVVQVTEYDAMSRFFTLVLRNGSADYEPPEGATYSVWYKTADSHGWYDTITEPDEGTHPAVVADGNAFTIEIAEQATTSCGELALMINGDDGYQLTVSGIITRSDDIPGYDGEEVENYYNVYITEMRENAARAENAADIAVAYGATVEVDEDAQQLNITHHSNTDGGVGWLFGSAVTSSAEGSVAAFPDGADDVAVKSLVAEITPVQSGSGDPSPTNIRPISGRTGLTVTRAGKNLFDGVFSQQGPSQIQSAALTLPAGTYTYSQKYNGTPIWGVYVKRPDNTEIAKVYNANNATFTLSQEESVIIRVYYSNGITPANITEAQIEVGSAATAYEPYAGQTYPITWESIAGTVYGGALDVVSGVLTVTDAQIASYAGETLPGEWISDRDVYVAGTTPTTGAQVVYKLATPQTYQLTPTEVRTILGGNTIYTDAGAVSVEYVADTKLYIDNKVAELQALILEN